MLSRSLQLSPTSSPRTVGWLLELWVTLGIRGRALAGAYPRVTADNLERHCVASSCCCEVAVTCERSAESLCCLGASVPHRTTSQEGAVSTVTQAAALQPLQEATESDHRAPSQAVTSHHAFIK